MPGVTTQRPAVSVLVDLEGWPEDTLRFLAALERYPPAVTPQVVVADRTGGGAAGFSDVGLTIDLPAGTGFGAARNAALRRATGDVVVLVDTSVEPTGDLFGPLVEALADPAVAVAGPFGLVTDNLYDYREQVTGEVAAVQGYCLAARRADLLAVGGVRETFVYYRNADIDLSFRLRTLSDRPGRAVALGAERCARHCHRAWEVTAVDDRDRLSRRNFGKIMDKFRGRADLIVRPSA